MNRLAERLQARCYCDITGTVCLYCETVAALDSARRESERYKAEILRLRVALECR